MRFKLTILILCLISPLSGGEIAQINDPDGYTNVRKEPDASAPVVGKMADTDLFYATIDTKSSWSKILSYKRNDQDEQIIGFMHTSRVQLLRNLSQKKQKALIMKLFEMDAEMDAALEKAEQGRKLKIPDAEENYSKLRDLDSNFFMEKYWPLMGFAPDNYCASKDPEILNAIVASAWLNKNSAFEGISYALGECFRCEPTAFTELLKKTEDQEKQRHLVGQIDWGLQNIFHQETTEKEQREFQTLKSLLEPYLADADS